MKSNTFAQKLKGGVASTLPSIMAILAGLILGFIILLFVNPSQALDGLWIIIRGSFKNTRDIGNMLMTATPIILTGLSVGFANKTGLFNIGASGQYLVGAFSAIFVGVYGAGIIPSSILWIVCILAGMVAGGIWGILPGLLKATCNVNEVITCIMMNYISMNLVNLLIKNTCYNNLQNRTQMVDAAANVPQMGLKEMFPYSSMNGAIFIAIFFVAIIYVLLQKTTFGYELKACGFNPDASKYAGINSKTNVVLSMVISGALAGIGGALMMQSGSFIEVKEVIPAEGFTGISVALLGMSNPIGTFFSGLFISHITVGGKNLQLLDYDKEIISIITGAIIYFSAFSLLFKMVISKIFREKKTSLAQVSAAPVTVAANLNNKKDTKDDSDKKGGNK